MDLPLPGPLRAVGGLIPSSGEEATELVKSASDTGRNVYEYLRYGGLKIDPVYSPYQVTASGKHYRLRHYFPDDAPSNDLPPLIFVPPLMILADVYDASPRTGPVGAVHEHGIDVWVIDFGAPEEVDGGLQRTVSDYVLAVSEVVDEVRSATGKDVVLSGYSQGGLFSYLAAALRHSDGVDSVITYGSSVVWEADTPMSIPMSTETYSTVARGLRASGLFKRISLSKEVARTLTKMTDPVKNVKFNYQYIKQLDDREKLLPNEQQRQFLDRAGWTAYPGLALEDLMDWVANRRLLRGGIVIGDRAVSLADMTNPILVATGEADSLGNPTTIRAVADAAPHSLVYELALKTGHFGIIASSGAKRNTWPRVADWLEWRAGHADEPAGVVVADSNSSIQEWRPGPVAQRLSSIVDGAVAATVATADIVDDVLGKTASVVRRATDEVGITGILPIFDDAPATPAGHVTTVADTDPDRPVLYAEDRVVTYRELDDHVDDVVKRLCAAGIRRDQRVGLLVSPTREGVALMLAVNRLGAVAVMLRSDEALPTQADVAHLDWGLVDGPNSHLAEQIPTITWCTTAGDDIPDAAAAVDLTAVNTARVALPHWYVRNSARPDEPAFAFFHRTASDLVVSSTTNADWMSSARAIALSTEDTVYLATPLSHPVTQVVGFGGALVGRGRVALAGGSINEFWPEVRRYGVTHVTYAGASLRPIVDAPRHDFERRHPVLVFLGSSMPANLRRRIALRFTDVAVVEVYLAPDAEAMLVDRDLGEDFRGTPAPGTPEVAVAKYDLAGERIRFDSSGTGRQCRANEAGMLISRNSDRSRGNEHRIRGMFTADDSWNQTGTLSRSDVAGHFRIIGPVADRISLSSGSAAPAEVRRSLEQIPSVDLVAVYAGGTDSPSLIAAVTLFTNADDITAWDLAIALRDDTGENWPSVIYVLDEIRVDTHGNPSPRGLPDSASRGDEPTIRATWTLDPATRIYFQP